MRGAPTASRTSRPGAYRGAPLRSHVVEPNDRPDVVDLTATDDDAAPSHPVSPHEVAGQAEQQGSSAPVEPGGADELELLAGIEQDLAAVEAAMTGLDRIDAQEIGGAAAAAQVEAIVGSGRFDVEA